MGAPKLDSASTKPRKKKPAMSRVIWIVMFAAFTAATAALAASAIPDLHGTWKGDSESIAFGGGNLHHKATQADEPELRSVSFTLTIDKQDGRRFSGTYSSSLPSFRAAEQSSWLTQKASRTAQCSRRNQMELCYLKQSSAARIASCTELTKQP
jgi:hypothetical protein